MRPLQWLSRLWWRLGQREHMAISGPKIGGPTMKQLSFDWNAEDKYNELKTFRLEVSDVLSTYNTPQTDNLALVKNWLG